MHTYLYIMYQNYNSYLMKFFLRKFLSSNGNAVTFALKQNIQKHTLTCAQNMRDSQLYSKSDLSENFAKVPNYQNLSYIYGTLFLFTNLLKEGTQV